MNHIMQYGTYIHTCRESTMTQNELVYRWKHPELKTEKQDYVEQRKLVYNHFKWKI